jgi:hypothetical protein
MKKSITQFEDKDILVGFRNALISLLPILIDFECLEDDGQPYDDYDEIAECLWNVIVCNSFAWKNGIDGSLEIGKYGFDEIGKDGFIEVIDNQSNERIRFIEFIGNREYGTEPFNAISGVNQSGERIDIQFTQELNFKWKKA